jgi:hypothetical protein
VTVIGVAEVSTRSAFRGSWGTKRTLFQTVPKRRFVVLSSARLRGTGSTTQPMRIAASGVFLSESERLSASCRPGRRAGGGGERPVSVKVLVGDARAVLAGLPEASVHTCVCSPPYFGLRSYSTEPVEWGGSPDCQHVWMTQAIRDRHGDDGLAGNLEGSRDSQAQTRGDRRSDTCSLCGCWKGELGSESSPDLYVAHLVEVFAAVRRVLRRDGTLWVVIGSSFASGKIQSQEYVLRDDLTDEERSYVYAELAKHFAAQSQAVPTVRQADAPTEFDLSSLLLSGVAPSRELSGEGV